MKIRDHSCIESGYLRECLPPAQDRNETKYTPIPSQPLSGYYYPQTGKIGSDDSDVTLGDWGVSSWADNHLTTLIQPVGLRAPEVLIKAPWDASTDVWNLGAVVYEVFRGRRLFQGKDPQNNKYNLKNHLAEIVEVLGPFPRTLLDKGDPAIVAEHFDEKGMVKGVAPPKGPDFCSEEWFPRLSDAERELSAGFIRTMMTIDPAKRPSPEDLTGHPWFGD